MFFNQRYEIEIRSILRAGSFRSSDLVTVYIIMTFDECLLRIFVFLLFAFTPLNIKHLMQLIQWATFFNRRAESNELNILRGQKNFELVIYWIQYLHLAV